MSKYKPKNINKNDAQSLYDSGMSLRGLAKHFNVAINTISRLGLETRSIAESSKFVNRQITPEGRAKMSETAKRTGLGGYRPHPNKGEYYKDTWFDSTWEVRLAKSLDEHNVSWIRPKQGFIWTDTGRKYYPDFYLPEHNVYLDPKNSYLQKKDAEKIKQASERNNIKVLILSEDQLTWDSVYLLL